jgi:defect-in-organelle-trafficking protein DotB
MSKEEVNGGVPEGMFSKGHDGSIFDVPGGRLDESSFDALLLWASERKVSDLTLTSTEHVWAEIGDTFSRVTSKVVNHNELQGLLRVIYGDNGPGMVNAGRDLDFIHVVKSSNGRLRFRVNATCGDVVGGRGFQLTIRSLPAQPPLLAHLDIEPEIYENLRPPQGVNFITGPTGSGKSTLLAALVRWRCEQPGANEKVLDYSSPIEFVHHRMNYPNSLVFSTAPGDHLIPPHDLSEDALWDYCIRNALRRKPAMVLIGEARDRATISGCIKAGTTGHLVMTTMHTEGVAETVSRALLPFKDEERRAIAADLLRSMNLCVTQLLLPKIGGGRVAVREYLVFDRKVRAALGGIETGMWAPRIRQIMDGGGVTGSTMAASAKKLMQRNLIEPDTYEWIAARTSNEARVVRDANAAGLMRNLGEMDDMDYGGENGEGA